MLKICTFFSVQIFSNNGVRIYSPKQCFSVVLGKRIVKNTHCYKRSLTLALLLVSKLFQTMALNIISITIFSWFSWQKNC